MFVDLQVALAGEGQGESAVLGHLFEHVIEEPQSGADLRRTLARQIEVDHHLGLLRGALDVGTACRAQDALRNGRPGLGGAAAEAHVSRSPIM